MTGALYTRYTVPLSVYMNKYPVQTALLCVLDSAHVNCYNYTTIMLISIMRSAININGIYPASILLKSISDRYRADMMRV